MIPGPNGCVCGHNGDCNCPFVATGTTAVWRDEDYEADADACDAGTCDDPNCGCRDSDEECTCSRSRADLADDRGFPCDACGRMVR